MGGIVNLLVHRWPDVVSIISTEYTAAGEATAFNLTYFEPE